MNELVRELARARNFDFAIEDHGMPVLFGAFEGVGWGQGFGLMVDVEFLRRFMAVWGVERLQQVNGRPCWVTHSNDSITLVEPLMAGEGEPFDVEKWRSELNKRAGKRRAKP